MQAQQIAELKKVATIGYVISGLSLGLWSSALLPRLNLAAVGAVASSAALSPVRKRQTELAIANAKKQLDADHAERREQLKDWEKELIGRSVDLDARQMDLDRELERLQRSSEVQQRELDRERELQEQERTIADRTADNEIRDRQRQLEAEYQQRFAMRQSEIEQEYAALDVERKTLDAERAQLETERVRHKTECDREFAAIESDRQRFELQQEKERELLDKQLQETLHSGLAQLEEDKREIEVQARQWVADALEPLHEEIASLQGENEALEEQLAVATYPRIPRGIDRVCVYLKEVIPALYKLGFKLDYDSHNTNPNRDRVWFRPQHPFDLKDLEKESGLIQGLIGSKHPLSWQWIDKGLIQLEVSTVGVETSTKTSKRKIADRIVSGEQWLIDLVDKCFHFRISGENGSGKSEFFNILFCIAKHRVFGGKLDLTLIDPKFPLSPWIIEGQPFVPQYRSWEDAPMGVADMAGLVDARINRAQSDFKPQDWLDGTSPEFAPSMWAIDETDTTMSRYKKEIKDNLRVGLKVGRALRVMVCYMCQSYLPSDIGLNHPDLKASATILLSTSAEEGADDLPMSKERRLEIKEEIAYLNAEGCKYFALVKYPGVQPFVARLPKPKAYSHLQFESATQAKLGCDTIDGATRDVAHSVARVTPLSTKGCSDLRDAGEGFEKADSGGVEDVTQATSIVPNGEASQSEIDRAIELYSGGIRSQEKIIKTVWGLSRNGRKGSKYQRKVEIVKAIKQTIFSVK